MGPGELGVRSSGKETYVATEKNDQSVLSHIDRLVKEEEHLYGKGELSADDRGRLAELKVALDQCWDLLRQRRALREFGSDPDKAKVRSAGIVENYEQKLRRGALLRSYWWRSVELLQKD